MKRLVALLAITIALGCAGAMPALAPVPEPLGWLAGAWVGEHEGAVVEEHWTEPRGGTMLGVARTIAGDKTVFFEYLRIEQSDEGTWYIASPKGGDSTRFEMVELNGQRAVFSNPDHDYPQRIIYWREGDRLHAKIEGSELGEQRSSEWSFTRARSP